MFIVIEIQKIGEELATIVTSFKNKNEAESKFYTVLSYAALSTVELHAASLLTEDGRCIRSESYTHPVLEEQTE